MKSQPRFWTLSSQLRLEQGKGALSTQLPVQAHIFP